MASFTFSGWLHWISRSPTIIFLRRFVALRLVYSSAVERFDGLFVDSTGNSTGCRRIRRAVGASGNRGRGYLEDFAHLRSTLERCSNFSNLFVAILQPHFVVIRRPLRSSLKQVRRTSTERNGHFDCSSCQSWQLQGRPQMDSLPASPRAPRYLYRYPIWGGRGMQQHLLHLLLF